MILAKVNQKYVTDFVRKIKIENISAISHGQKKTKIKYEQDI